jgi:hypothetical protein
MGEDQGLQIARNTDGVPGLPRLIAHATRYVYCQLIQKIIFTAIALSLFVCAWWTIARDIASEQRHLDDESRGRVAECEREYAENNCADTGNLLPALVRFCQEREDCLAFQPSAIARSAVAARHLGGLLNAFLDPLSFKALGVIAAAIAAALWLPGLLAGSAQN